FEALLAAELLLIDDVRFHQTGLGPIGSGDRSRTRLCIPKAPGEAGFTLDTACDLGFAAEHAFQLTFTARRTGESPAGLPLMEWSVDQQVGRTLDVMGFGLRLNAIRGSVAAELSPQAPAA